ncbi:glycine cleavage system aminomethyltransferase GcvT [Faecalicatena contorta]|uniref:Aminomethyltransferase n=1 Tax=Faecalicatena fissicatena TaxID=290055 RepID=A0ABS2E734_9FIRM|nr:MULTISPECIES: glycine cleavage system aminomethyltransferase GcvT [Faecalicatena]MBM6686151.1 glycine cleavage system aminomethyltransferase GcvT [Faecalicatena contorta]MBM6711539.1 glycine cleavage system aminomethyltransferase GcvT [Faecalicatena contorta]MBM6737453.1 glycine cleavage system aminomethyltransferase GcvT [Faecalicatena fissicatena]
MELKTPLYEAHVKAGGKIVPFGGYLLPVQYKEGVIKEHMAVRTQAGLFDVSHMGEILCQGKDALANLQMMLTNNFDNLTDGQARYSPMCNEQGGTVDDLIVYKKGEEDYFIVVNAANKDKDYQWMLDHQFGEVTFTDVSDQYAQLALQGPKAMEILRKLAPEENIPKKYYHAVFDTEAAGIPCIISKTGYTGEDGVEIYLDSARAQEMWDALLEAGKEEGLIPCGLGARDTLRMEAAMPLYGHEMDEQVTPLEAGLGFAVKMTKEDFIGKKALEEKGEPARKRIGLTVTGRGIIREHQDVYLGDRLIGHTTSGTHCPYLGCPVAMALVDADCTEPGTKVEADVRGRRVEAQIVPLPFYKRSK